MASETTKMAVIGNRHMDVRVVEFTELNSVVISDLRGHYHCRPLVFRAIALLLHSASVAALTDKANIAGSAKGGHESRANPCQI